jgi:hypothetical protein
MSFLYIVLLAVFTFVCFGIGQGTNTAAGFASAGFFIGAIALYFCPTVVAQSRDHPSRTSITVLNVLLGWTFIGWVGTLAWAYSRRDEKVPVVKVDEPQPEPPSAGGVRLCPFCAEEVKAQAVKCKHCGSNIGADGQAAA